MREILLFFEWKKLGSGGVIYPHKGSMDGV